MIVLYLMIWNKTHTQFAQSLYLVTLCHVTCHMYGVWLLSLCGILGHEWSEGLIDDKLMHNTMSWRTSLMKIFLLSGRATSSSIKLVISLPQKGNTKIVLGWWVFIYLTTLDLQLLARDCDHNTWVPVPSTPHPSSSKEQEQTFLAQSLQAYTCYQFRNV